MHYPAYYGKLENPRNEHETYMLDYNHNQDFHQNYSQENNQEVLSIMIVNYKQSLHRIILNSLGLLSDRPLPSEFYCFLVLRIHHALNSRRAAKVSLLTSLLNNIYTFGEIYLLGKSKQHN